MSKLVCIVVASLVLGATALPARATVLTFDLRYSSNPATFANNLYWGSTAAYLPYFTTYGDHVAGATQNLVVPYPQPSPTTSYNVTYNYTQGNAYTPHIGVANSSVGVVKIYDDGDAPRIIYPEALGDSMIFTFTPDPGYSVRLNSFDLRSYYNGAGTAPDDSLFPRHNFSAWALYENTLGGTVLASSTSTGASQVGGTASSFPVTKINPAMNITTNTDYFAGTLVLKVDYVSGQAATLTLDNVNFDEAIPEPASLALLGLGGLLLAPRRRARNGFAG